MGFFSPKVAKNKSANVSLAALRIPYPSVGADPLSEMVGWDWSWLWSVLWVIVRSSVTVYNCCGHEDCSWVKTIIETQPDHTRVFAGCCLSESFHLVRITVHTHTHRKTRTQENTQPDSWNNHSKLRLRFQFQLFYATAKSALPRHVIGPITHFTQTLTRTQHTHGHYR